MVIIFPIKKAFNLPDAHRVDEDTAMSPENTLREALTVKDYKKAIRLISSVKELQTDENILSCSKTQQDAFNLLRLVPKSRNLPEVIDLACTSPRVARLVIEDIPQLVTDDILRVAINGEEAWADKYHIEFGLSSKKIKSLLLGNEDFEPYSSVEL